MSDVTLLLEAASGGDPKAAARLLPLVYAELRTLAAARMAAERPDHTLPPTALVHEAYLRLVGGSQPDDWSGRGHFFAAAAEAMRRVLVDHAREKSAGKRGGRWGRVPLDVAITRGPDRADDLLDLDDALTALERTDRVAADLVKCRYFAGLTQREAATALGLAPRTADAVWAYARAWLLDRLGGAPGGESPAES